MCSHWVLVTLLVLSALVLDQSNVAADGRHSLSSQINNTTVTASVQGREPRILGGKEAPEGAFPYQAGVLRSDGVSPFCGASIVDNRSLVTAAHCVFKDNKLVKPKKLRVLVGSTHYPSATKMKVSAIFVHPQYNAETIENDIAVLRTEKNFTFGRTIQPIRLSTTTPMGGTPCNVSGWGTTKNDGKTVVSQLRFVTVPIVKNATCSQMTKNVTGMLCAGGESNEDSCSGDSGGPLVCNDALTGVVSWGYQCGKKGYPGVYTNVAMYNEFVAYSLVRSRASKNLTKSLSTLYVVAALLTSMWVKIHS